MHFAKIRGQQGLVEASDRLPRIYDHYLCPLCGGRVTLRAGTKRVPYFAHYPGEGSPECELYNPNDTGSDDAGSALRAQAAGATKAVEDAPAEPGLCLDPESAMLYLRIPELLADDLGRAPLRALLDAKVAVRVGIQKVGEISAMELRPGSGRARVEVQPSASEYTLAAEGGWPSGVDRGRWAARSPGLSMDGVLFRLRRGEWTRLRQRSLVEWGETLFLAYPSTCYSLPVAMGPARTLGRPFRGTTWHFRQLILPLTPDLRLENWLYRLGHWVVPPAWSIRLIRPPDFGLEQGGHRRFAAGRPVLAEIRPPVAGAMVRGSLTFRMATQDSEITAPQAGGSAFLKVETEGVGLARVALADDKRSTLSFEVSPSLGLEALQQALASVPRLRLRVGDMVIEPWSPPHEVAIMDGSAPEVEFVGAPEEVRLTVATGWPEIQAVERDVSIAHATALLETLLLGTASVRVLVDAKGLGTFHLTLSAKALSQERAPRQEPGRLANWAGAVAGLHGPAQHSAWMMRQASLASPRTRLLAAQRGTSPHLTRLLKDTSRYNTEGMKDER